MDGGRRALPAGAQSGSERGGPVRAHAAPRGRRRGLPGDGQPAH